MPAGHPAPLTCLSLSSAWPRYRIIGATDSGQFNLEITDAALSDDALYECQATEAALRSRRAKLTVLSELGRSPLGKTWLEPQKLGTPLPFCCLPVPRPPVLC